MAEIVGRDCFFNSLENPQLRIKILELQPANLDEALNHVCRLKAYESLLPDGAEVNGSEERKKVRSVKPEKTVTFASTTETQKGEQQRGGAKIKQLEIEQVSMRRRIQQASADVHFWRERALAAESGGWSPRNSGWPTFPPPMQPQFPPQSSGFGSSGGPQRRKTPMHHRSSGPGAVEAGGRRGGYMYTTADSTDRTPPDTCWLCRNKGH